jgi:spermidine/putrescine transport system substrate-binding protein
MAGRPLRLLTWDGMPDAGAIREVAARLGREAKVTAISTNEQLEELMTYGGPWDAVFPSDYMVERLRDAGRLLPLELGDAPEGLAAWARECPFDPGNRHSVPFAFGTTGFLADPAAVPGDSWLGLFAPPEGVRVGMLGEFREVIGAALIAAGGDPNALEPANLGPAREILRAQRPSVARFDSDDFTGPVLAGRVGAHHAWSGPAAKAVRESGGRLRYVLPREGAVLWVTCGSVPSSAPEPDLSMALLAGLMEPELAATATENGGYATPNEAARRLLTPELAEDPSLFPGEETIERCTVLVDVDDGAAEALFAEVVDSL